MAIIKHISMKSANYTKTIEYLTLQHDEYTMKPYVNEQGIVVMRENIIFEGINCDPFTYDQECYELNRTYRKNMGTKDVKQHHYIISFDPKDRTELGLTATDAQAIGMEYARRNFPGYQTLVCTHEDGHNHSGNIHVHIIFNSLRKYDVDERPFMERPCDHKAGYKHHDTKKFLRHLKKDLMEMCRNRGLHQVDLLKRAKEKITDKEYYANRRMQERREQAAEQNEADKSTHSNKQKSFRSDKEADRNRRSEQHVSESQKARKQTPFELQKDYLRRAINDVKTKAKNDDGFASLLMQNYGIRLTVSRGKFGYLHPDRTKPIRGRQLGTDYEETSLRQVFSENQKTEAKTPKQKDTSVAKTSKKKATKTMNNTNLKQKATPDNPSAKTTGRTDKKPSVLQQMQTYQNGIDEKENAEKTKPVSEQHSEEISDNTIAHIAELIQMVNSMDESNKSDDQTKNLNDENTPAKTSGDNAKETAEPTKDNIILHKDGSWTDYYGFRHAPLPKLPKNLTEHTDLRLVRNLQECAIAEIADNYVHNRETQDLLELSRTVAYAIENGFDTLDGIDQLYEEKSAIVEEATNQLVEAKEKMDSVNETIHFTGAYLATKGIYSQYRSRKQTKSFRWQHRKEITDHEMAAAFFKSNGITNLPDIDKLKKVKAEVLTPAFNNSLEAYKEKCADLTEIKIMHHNIHALLDGNWGQERAAERPQKSPSKPKISKTGDTR